MSTNPVLSSRIELAKLIPENGKGAELGVARGDFSVALLTAHSTLRLTSIDLWGDEERFHNEEEMREASKRLFAFNPRSTVVRASFEAWAKHVPNRSLDFIYVDGYAHTGQEGGQTLDLWFPKLKVGGVFAGHDYDFDRWPLTVASVDSFAFRHKLALHTTKEPLGQENVYRSWYFLC